MEHGMKIFRHTLGGNEKLLGGKRFGENNYFKV